MNFVFIGWCEGGAKAMFLLGKSYGIGGQKQWDCKLKAVLFLWGNKELKEKGCLLMMIGLFPYHKRGSLSFVIILKVFR